MNGNIQKVWEVAAVANRDYAGVLAEYESGARTPNAKFVELLRSRVWDTLDKNTMDKILKTAAIDIKNILRSMKPTKSKITVYRNVRQSDALKEYAVGAEVDIMSIISTSAYPVDTSYSKEKVFTRYEIALPIGTKHLPLDPFDPQIRNEDGEILLPPLKLRIISTRVGSGNCARVVQMDLVENL